MPTIHDPFNPSPESERPPGSAQRAPAIQDPFRPGYTLPPPKPRHEAADYAKLLGVGAGQLARGVGSLADMATGGASTRFMEEKAGRSLTDIGEDVSEFYRSRLSPAMQESMEKRFISEQPGEVFGEAWTDPHAILGTAVQSLPLSIPGLGAAGTAGRVAGGMAARGAVARGATEEAARAAALRAGGATATTVGGLTEGGISAGLVGADVESAVLNSPEEALSTSPYYQQLLSQGTPLQEARALTARAARDSAALPAGVATGILGSYFNNLIGRWMAGGRPGGRLAAAGHGAAAEGITEFAQEGQEAFQEQRALRDFAGGPEINWRDILNQAVAGSVAGGVIGAGFGALAPGEAPLPQAPPPPAPAPETGGDAAQALPLGLPSPDLVVFPDGTTARRGEVEQAIAHLESQGTPEAQQQAMALRAQLLGMGSQPADSVPPETPAPQLPGPEEAPRLEHKGDLVVFPNGAVAEPGRVEQLITYLRRQGRNEEARRILQDLRRARPVEPPQPQPQEAQDAQAVRSDAREVPPARTPAPESQREGRPDLQRPTLAQPAPRDRAPLGEAPPSETPNVRTPAAEKIDQAAQEAATSPENSLPEPTEAEKQAGNYKKGHVRLHGLDIRIENPQGSTRSGTDSDGHRWEQAMAHHYGYVKGSEARDGDHVDVFLGPQAENPDLPVFVVDQVDPKTGQFDEPKAMLGFASEEDARQGYLANYEPGWQGLGAISPMSLEAFKEWVQSPAAKKPAAESRPRDTKEIVSTETPVGETQRLPAEASEAEVPETVPPEAPETGPFATEETAGRSTTAQTPRGTQIEAQYQIMDLADLITSHDPQGNVNPRFPAELQPRDRARQASQAQIARMAQQLNPAFLGESPQASTGAPIIGPDNVVESGNGRVAALRRHYQNGGRNYRQWLQENAERFGLDPAQAQRMTAPVLVRMRQTPARGVAARQLFDHAAKLMRGWKNRPKVNIVDSFQQLPEAIRTEALKASDGADIEGVWWKGRVYLVAENIASLERAETVILHEVRGHYGLRGMLGDRLVPVLNQVFLAYGKTGLKEIADRYGYNLDKRADRLAAAEEKLAHLAQTGERPGILKQVYALLRDWLRRMGFTLKLNNADLALLVEKSARFVERGRTPRPARAAGAPAFHRAYHGTPHEVDQFSLHKIGTGEGAQRQGWGLYFSDQKAVAEYYRDKLSDPGTGRLYEVELIPDPEDYLDWDRPLSQQSPQVKSALAQAERESGARLMKAPQTNPGRAAYATLTFLARRRPAFFRDRGIDFRSPEEAASKYLNRMGIPGVRGKGRSGATEYTIFDDRLVDIEARFSRRPREVLDDLQAQARRRPTAGEYVKHKIEDWRPGWLGALTRLHLADVARTVLPQAKGYVTQAQQMDADRNHLLVESAEIAQRWGQYQRKFKQEGKRLSELMHDATILGVDPAEEFKPMLDIEAHQQRILALTEKAAQARDEARKTQIEGRIKPLREEVARERERIRQYPLLQARYQALSGEGKNLYREVRDHYSQRYGEVYAALKARIQRAAVGEEQKKALIARLRQRFESARVAAPYFPLARFGDFWVRVKDGPEAGFYMFESSRPQQRFARQQQAQGHEVTVGKSLENIKAVQGASEGFVAEVIGIMDAAGLPQSAPLKDAIYQLYLTTLPDLSVRKHFIHRKKTYGYNEDALRAFAKQTFHGAYQLARLRHTDILERQLDAMRQHIPESPDPNKASDLYQEFLKRHEWIMNPRGSQWSQFASSLGFAWYLGLTPAAALVNTTQTPLVAFPVLGARYGFGKSARALNRAMADYFRGGFHIKKSKTVQQEFGGDTLRAMDELVQAGVLDRTLAHDLAGMGETDSRVYNDRHAKMMGGIAFLFHQAEVFNREVTALAAYRLARGAGKSHAEAVTEAKDTVYESHFDYGASNKARFMQNDAARVLLMFRQFSLNMTYLLARNAYQTFKGESPEVRAEARRKLSGLLGMHALAAGAMGMPLFSLVAAVMNALFDDPDEPYDFETEFRNALADYLGPEAAEAVARGPVSALTGADLASRVSLDGLWFREPDRDLEGRAWVQYWLQQLAGPLFGIAAGVGTAYDFIQEGHVQRGIEAATPKVIKDGLRMLRYGQEGVQTLRGDPILEDIGAWDRFLQGMGFRPGQLVNRMDANRALKNKEQRILDRKRHLLNRYALSVRMQDTGMRRDTLESIRRFNRANPTVAITPATLKQSLTARARASNQARHGMFLSRNLRGLEREVRFGVSGG